MNAPDVISSITFVLTATISISGVGTITLGEYASPVECEAQKQIMVRRYRESRTPALVSCAPHVKCVRECFEIRPK